MFEFLKKHDVFLWPETKGKLTLGGDPLSGVTIVREVFYDTSIVETTITSSTGSFSFRDLNIRSRTPGKLFTEARTIQAITAEYRNDRYLLWAYATDSIVEEPLISEKLKDLKCDLNNEERYHHFPRPDSSHLTYNTKGICRWHAATPTTGAPTAAGPRTPTSSRSRHMPSSLSR